MITVSSLPSEISPVNKGFRREQAMVRTSGEKNAHIAWIDVPEGKKTATNSNHWLILAFFLAYERKTDVEIDGAVDELLVKNLRGINHIFNSWFKEKYVVKVSSQGQYRTTDAAKFNSALFFSGGVDSMFSLFNAESETRENSINELITVWGFDISLSKPEEFRKLQKTVEKVAAKTQKILTPIITNIRSIGEPYSSHWGDRGHGAALAVVGHLLSPEFNQVRIASSFDYENVFPWGSHPFTDPLFSSSNLSIVHDGAAWSRVDKTGVLANFDIALETIHVCHKQGSADNCSQCPKCIRTMLTIDCLNAKERATAFNWSKYNLDKLEPILISNWLDRAFFEDIDRAAKKAGRSDINEFVRRSIKFSKWLRPVPGFLLGLRPIQNYISLAKKINS